MEWGQSFVKICAVQHKMSFSPHETLKTWQPAAVKAARSAPRSGLALDGKGG
jgi:hypothetical protein